ncbi:1,3-beta-glucan synthase [Bertholletia excelsa]
MVRSSENWERLVRATLQREQLRRAGQGRGRISSGIADAVPASLTRETNIDLILQAADEIQSEDPNVARIRKSFCLMSLLLVSPAQFHIHVNVALHVPKHN